MGAKEKFFELLEGQPLQKGDVIFVMQGDGLHRAPHAVELYKVGFAPLVAIVGSANDRSYGSFPSGEVRDEMTRLGLPPSALHFEEVGPHTLGEARRAMELAKEKGWATILIVTSPHHQYRAFLTFLSAMKKSRLSLALINACAPLSWEEQLPWGKRSDLLKDEFRKIEEYGAKGDIATYEEGVEYLRTCV